jgi:hypothetical protein
MNIDFVACGVGVVDVIGVTTSAIIVPLPPAARRTFHEVHVACRWCFDIEYIFITKINETQQESDYLHPFHIPTRR